MRSYSKKDELAQIRDSDVRDTENIACIQQAEHISNWCGKCLCNMLRHNKIDCPAYEGCSKCWVCGPIGFLKTHQCVEEEQEEDLVNDPGADVYDYISSD